jgi:hypothetical protein
VGLTAALGHDVPVITIYFDGDQTLWDFQGLMRRTLGVTIEELRRLVPDLDGDLSVDAFVIDRQRASQALRGTTTNLEAIRLAACRGRRALRVNAYLETGGTESGTAVAYSL